MSLDNETIAKLLLSIGNKKKWRYFDPIETAKIIDQLCKKYSQKEIAKKLGVSTEMIREFRSLLTLSDKVKMRIKNRDIGIDTGYRISLLKDKKEQDILIDAIIAKNITSKEVKGIIQSLKKSNPDMDMKEAIDIAIKYRPIIDEEQIIITKLNQEIIKDILNVSNLKNITPSKLITNILSKEISNSDYVLSAHLSGEILILGLKNEGYEILKTISNKLKININNVINEIVSKEVKKTESYK